MAYRYWSVTVPSASGWAPPGCLPEHVVWMRGQEESGASGYVHWQVAVCFAYAIRRNPAKLVFCEQAHLVKSRSDALDAYVWKEDTRIASTQFELGKKPSRKGGNKELQKKRQAEIIDLARDGDFKKIRIEHPSAYMHQLRNLKLIRAEALWEEVENLQVWPRRVFCLWGPTRTGKSHRARTLVPPEHVFAKSGRDKWWEQYNGQKWVVIEEFDFKSDNALSDLLMWLDNYVVSVEFKGGKLPLLAKVVILTSNVEPYRWFKDADKSQIDALLERMNVFHVTDQQQALPAFDACVAAFNAELADAANSQ